MQLNLQFQALYIQRCNNDHDGNGVDDDDSDGDGDRGDDDIRLKMRDGSAWLTPQLTFCLDELSSWERCPLTEVKLHNIKKTGNEK